MAVLGKQLDSMILEDFSNLVLEEFSDLNDSVILLFVSCLAEPALREEAERLLVTVMMVRNAQIQHVLSLNQLIHIYKMPL